LNSDREEAPHALLVRYQDGGQAVINIAGNSGIEARKITTTSSPTRFTFLLLSCQQYDTF